MKAFIKALGFLLMSLPVFTACNVDDDGSYKLWIGYATVKLNSETQANEQPDFDLILDDDTEMRIVSNMVYFPAEAALKDDTRVIANFTILSEQVVNGKHTLYIRLNAMKEVLSKKPVYSSSVDADEIGFDPIDVDEAWFGGKYLNFTFNIRVNDPSISHFINLYVDEDHPEADEDNIYVELRHNAYGDKPAHEIFRRVSFNISEFLEEEKSSVTVHLKYTNYKGEEVTDSGVYYRKNTQSGGTKSISERQENEYIY